MTPELFTFLAPRVKRLVRDLNVDPTALLVDPADFALIDGVTRRRLTPALHNETMAEGLTAAIKLAHAAVEGTLP